MDLFPEEDYPLVISAPDGLLPSNLERLGSWPLQDRSDDWYVIARTAGGDAISIDLAPARLGRCYDSASDVHGVQGSSAVVATTFTELLTRALAGRGQHWWWLADDFVSMGDAYDA